MSFYLNSTGKVIVYTSRNSAPLIISNSSVSLNSWSNVAIVRSGNNLLCYINGVLDKTTAFAISILNSNLLTAYIGYEGYSGDYWTGYIDNVKVFNSALTQTQINNI